jgi:glycerol-3-phosphate dehydrogenase
VYDLLVIGGGINGLGIAADGAARGLKTLLVEKGDFGGGTTAASSRLIHGGLRYLQYGEFSLVRESLRERRILARQRPHLVRPIRLLIPTYRGGALPPWKLGAGLALYGLLAGRSPEFDASAHLSRDRVRDREPGILQEGLTGGFTYPDAQIDFPERLCV